MTPPQPPSPDDLSQSRSFYALCAATAALAVVTLIVVPLFPEIEALIVSTANLVERLLRERP